MLSCIQRLIAGSLLAVYGGIALLGHAGLHALEGTHHVHGHATAATDRHSHSHAHGCHHDHSYGPAADHQHSQPGGENDHHHDGPEHDHDNCLICHHFAAKAALVTAAAPLNLAEGIEHIDCVRSDDSSGADRYVLPIRGPPAAAC